MEGKRLPEKLRTIRTGLGLSQNGILRQMGLEQRLERSYISAYERGVLDPPYYVLLRYALLAGICTDILIDDREELPKSLPAKPKHKP